MKMTEFRSQQPLNDDDFKTIRRNVMTTIAARRERRLFPLAIRFALAAAVIAIAIFTLAPHRETTPASVATTTTTPAVVNPIAPAPITLAPITVAPVAVAQVSRPVTHRPRHRRTPQIELAHQNIRVEFRTSDPDIRIIWIASQTPNTTSGGKS